MRTCNTTNCGRATPNDSHAYCSTCLPVVLRTGREPVLPVFVPEWRRRAAANQLPVKETTRSAA